MGDSILRIVRYTAEQKERWDRFIPLTKNATFLFCRDYMDYHADRFADCSFLFYKGECLIALLPGHIKQDTWCTHKGLTYGGFLLSYQVTMELMMEMFRLLCQHLVAEVGAVRMVYQAIPAIYHRYPSEEDLYALFHLRAQLTYRKISSVIPLSEALPFRQLHLRKLKQARRSMLTISNDAAFSLFWTMLEANLRERHDALPVHSLAEIIRLHSLFPEQIELFRVMDGDETVAGCVMYVMEKVARVQYIASTESGRKMGALDLLFDHLIREQYKSKAYFDLGTSMTDDGCYFSEGLIFQKEGFGGRGIVYDTYELSLK